MPSVAVRELERDPEGLFDLIWLRSYAQAKAAYEAAETDDKRTELLRANPMAVLVETSVYEIQGEALKARRAAKARHG